MNFLVWFPPPGSVGIPEEAGKGIQRAVQEVTLNDSHHMPDEAQGVLDTMRAGGY